MYHRRYIGARSKITPALPAHPIRRCPLPGGKVPGGVATGPAVGCHLDADSQAVR